MTDRRRTALCVAAITVLAAALRAAALNYGLPDVHHPDEIPILNRALAFAKGDLNPHNFLYPTLYFYVLFAWETMFFAVGRVIGLYSSVGAFQREFFTDPTHVVLAGRALTATFGVLTVPAVYRFGAHLYGRAVGVGAALFLAVAPFAVRDAHYIKHDVPTTFFVVLAFVFFARIVVDPAAAGRRSTWLLAGAMAGLAMSTHYYAVFIVVPFAATFAAHVTRNGRWQGSIGLLLWGGVASAVAFFAASPYMLVEPHTVVRDLVGVREVDIDRAVEGMGFFQTFGPYARMLVVDALGWAVGVAGVVGLVAAIISEWRRGLLMLSFVGAFLAFCSNTVPMSRYLNVTLPVMAVAAAYILVRVAAWLAARLPSAGLPPKGGSHTPRAGLEGGSYTRRGWREGGSHTPPAGLPALAPAAWLRALAPAAWLPALAPAAWLPALAGREGFVAVVLIAAAALPGLAGSIRSDRFYGQADTRTLAREFIEREVPAGASILIQPHGVNLKPTRENLVDGLEANLGSASRATIKYQIQLGLNPYPSPAYRLIYLGEKGEDAEKIYVSPRQLGGSGGLQPLRDIGVQYVVMKRYNVEDPVLAPLQAALARDARLIATFSPYAAGVGTERRAAAPPFFHNTAARIDPALERPGPVVEVWRIDR